MYCRYALVCGCLCVCVGGGGEGGDALRIVSRDQILRFINYFLLLLPRLSFLFGANLRAHA